MHAAAERLQAIAGALQVQRVGKGSEQCQLFGKHISAAVSFV